MALGVLDTGQEKDEEFKLFCFSISKFSSSVQFILCSAAVFILYISYGYVLELIFTLEGMHPFGWFLTLLQFGFYSLFAYLQLLITRKSSKRRIPIETYVLISALTVGTMGFSNSSMGYLNFPTQVIFKSCKLIPVMIGSIVILQKQYNFVQILACLLMSGGLIWFTLADSLVQPSFTTTGVTLISLALLCDAIIGNVQEGAMKLHKEPSTVVVLYSYFFGFFFIFVALIISGTFLPALFFSLQHPWEVYGRCVLLSIAGFCGVQVVLHLVSRFGALTAVTVTTFRKAFSICLSFILFSKPFTIHYIWSGLLVALGIYLNVYGKMMSQGSFLVPFQKLNLYVISRFLSRYKPFKTSINLKLLDV